MTRGPLTRCIGKSMQFQATYEIHLILQCDEFNAHFNKYLGSCSGDMIINDWLPRLSIIS